MIPTEMNALLNSVHTGPRESENGPCQPPRNSTVNSRDITTMPAYSESRKNAKRSPLYSVNGPITISESAMGMSKGERWSSATAATKKTIAPGSCHNNHNGCHAVSYTHLTLPTIYSV